MRIQVPGRFQGVHVQPPMAKPSARATSPHAVAFGMMCAPTAARKNSAAAIPKNILPMVFSSISSFASFVELVNERFRPIPNRHRRLYFRLKDLLEHFIELWSQGIQEGIRDAIISGKHSDHLALLPGEWRAVHHHLGLIEGLRDSWDAPFYWFGH